MSEVSTIMLTFSPFGADHLQSNLSCLLYGPGKVRYEDRPVPEIEDDHDVLIHISYVGVCGSDVKLTDP